MAYPKLEPTYRVSSNEQSPISSGICPESPFDFKSLNITQHSGGKYQSQFTSSASESS